MVIVHNKIPFYRLSVYNNALPPHVLKLMNSDSNAFNDFVNVPFPIQSNHLSFNLQRRRENQRRLGEFGPKNEVLFTIPDEGPGSYLKRFSSDGRVINQQNKSLICLFLVHVCVWRGKQISCLSGYLQWESFRRRVNEIQ